MSSDLKTKLALGKKIEEALTQPKFSPMSQEEILVRFKAIGGENIL